MERDHMGYYSHPSSDSYYGGWRNYPNFGWQSQNQRNFIAPCSNYLEPPSPYSYQEPPSDIEAPQKKGVMKVETLNAILAQNKLMSQQLNLLTQQMGSIQVSAIDTQNSLQKVNYIRSAPGNPNNDPYSKTHNQGWRNHPNFGWRDQPQRPQNFNNNSQGGFQQNNFNNHRFQSTQQANSKFQEDSNWEMMMNFMQETRASIRNLEVQMGQISKQLPERSASTFPSDTVVNPREDCKVIQLRSGKVAGSETKGNEELVEKESHQEEEVEIEEACKEVVEFKVEQKGVELARPLPKPSPSNTTFKNRTPQA
ncbi:hypothetical protein AHAS_Ahas18G0190500 [Arachis hypogaea]